MGTQALEADTHVAEVFATFQDAGKGYKERLGMDCAALSHLFEDAPQVPKVVRGMEVPKDVLEMDVVIPIPDHTRILGLSEEPQDVLVDAPQSPRDVLHMEVPKEVLDADPQVLRDVLAMEAPRGMLEMDGVSPIPGV